MKTQFGNGLVKEYMLYNMVVLLLDYCTANKGVDTKVPVIMLYG